jgi:hypothetical protein
MRQCYCGVLGYSEHALRHRERVAPVVVRDVAVILANGQREPTQEINVVSEHQNIESHYYLSILFLNVEITFR